MHYNITITPYCIGNSIGACAWLLKCNFMNILYLVGYNVYSEQLIDGTDIENISRLFVNYLITDYRPQLETPNKKEEKEKCI